ncbi:MAG: hypothetical protein ACREUZ_22480, partial [Burkholderiales bacterium]
MMPFIGRPHFRAATPGRMPRFAGGCWVEIPTGGAVAFIPEIARTSTRKIVKAKLGAAYLGDGH